MGTTTASLHILLPPAPAVPLIKFPGRATTMTEPRLALEKAYAKLGWGAPARGATAQRHVVLAAGPTGFLSVYDSTCADLDDGSLKELAALVSQAMATAAIVTTVTDSDAFEFILYYKGKQADASNCDDSGLKTVRGRRQAGLWHDAFGVLNFRKVTDSAGDRFTDRLAVFVARAGAVAKFASPFAEDRLAAWCDLAGLPVQAALARAADRAADGSVVGRLDLAPRPLPRKAAAALIEAGRTLAFLASSDDYPYHGFFPAAWPVAPNVPRVFTWPVVCRGGGIASLRLNLHIDRTGLFALKKLSVAAFSFHNGQIMSATPLASFGQMLEEEIGFTEADISIHAENFNLRPPAPGSKSNYILLIRAEFETADDGEAMITPTLRPDDAPTVTLILPALCIKVTRPAWMPIVADPLDSGLARQDALLRLNAPALHTAVAILSDTGDDVRAAIRFLFEQIAAPITHTDLTATVLTQKHMTPSFSVPKASHTLPVQSLLQGPLWRKLFDTASNYQTIRIGIGLAGAPWPLAGLTLQTSLRDGHGGDAGSARFGGPSVTAAFWVVAEDSALALLSLDPRASLNSFTAWVRGAAPLQAWAADCAWIPEFDYYDDYMMTPYETVSQVDWFRLNLKGVVSDRAWLRRRLRFVAPLLWLGWELAEQVDTVALTGFAQVTGIDDGVEIALRDRLDMNRLEKALAVILPLNV